MIKEIKLIIRQPADKLSLSAWERKGGGVTLPSDLRDYYMSTNGFKLTWSLEHAGDILKIGEMNVNSIAHLISLDSPSPSDLLLGEKSSPNISNLRPSTTKPSSSVLLDSRKPGTNNSLTPGRTGKDSTGGIITKFPSMKASSSGSNQNAGNKNTKDSSKFSGSGESSQDSLMYYQDLRQTMVN